MEADEEEKHGDKGNIKRNCKHNRMHDRREDGIVKGSGSGSIIEQVDRQASAEPEERTSFY